MNENEKIFRKKSLERISSVQQLGAYIKVSSPPVWMILVSIALLVLGVFVWGLFGHLDTTMRVACVSSGGRIVCYVKEDRIEEVEKGQTVRVDGVSCSILDISSVPEEAGESVDKYARHLAELSDDMWVYEVSLSGSVPDGVYLASILTQSQSPLTYITN